MFKKAVPDGVPLEIALGRSTVVIQERDGQQQHSDRQWCLNDAQLGRRSQRSAKKIPPAVIVLLAAAAAAGNKSPLTE